MRFKQTAFQLILKSLVVVWNQVLFFARSPVRLQNRIGHLCPRLLERFMQFSITKLEQKPPRKDRVVPYYNCNGHLIKEDLILVRIVVCLDVESTTQRFRTR